MARSIIGMAVSILILLLGAGRVVWIGAYIVILHNFIIWYFIFIYTKSNYKEFSENRKNINKPVFSFDATLIAIIESCVIFNYLASSISIRYNFMTFDRIYIMGIVLIIFSLFIRLKSFVDNPYSFEIVVVRNDINHNVIDSGIYSLIRHPIYLSTIILFISMPLLLQSKIIIFSSFVIILTILYRIKFEEKIMIHDMPGYLAYMNVVKYRLIPKVW